MSYTRQARVRVKHRRSGRLKLCIAGTKVRDRGSAPTGRLHTRPALFVVRFCPCCPRHLELREVCTPSGATSGAVSVFTVTMQTGMSHGDGPVSHQLRAVHFDDVRVPRCLQQAGPSVHQPTTLL
jgi:hypothetical protein